MSDKRNNYVKGNVKNWAIAALSEKTWSYEDPLFNAGILAKCVMPYLSRAPFFVHSSFQRLAERTPYMVPSYLLPPMEVRRKDDFSVSIYIGDSFLGFYYWDTRIMKQYMESTERADDGLPSFGWILEEYLKGKISLECFVSALRKKKDQLIPKIRIIQ